MILLHRPCPLMICRHAPGDRNCSAYGGGYKYTAPEPKTPDANNFEIIDALEKGGSLILKVKYPNCSKCAFEGTKVLVFFNVKAIDALKWNRIDPHFRDDKVARPGEAPSPNARFPASPAGWDSALLFCDNV